MNPETTKDWSEVAKNYAQIIAVIIAGFWTYHVFKQKDVPGLETRGTVSSFITWYKLSDNDKSLVDFYVNVENKGSSSFDVSSLRVRSWEFFVDTQKEGLSYIDPESIRAGKPFFDKTYQLNESPSSPFPAHYPPGASIGNSFDWIVKPDCKKWILFAADVYKKGVVETPTWSTYLWWQQCPHPEQSTPTSPSNSSNPSTQ